MKLSVYRYDPDADTRPRMQAYEIEPAAGDRMLLDVILRLKKLDPSLSLRKSCREGVCGSDAMNINGFNGLACITPLKGLKQPVVLRLLPHDHELHGGLSQGSGPFNSHRKHPRTDGQGQPVSTPPVCASKRPVPPVL